MRAVVCNFVLDSPDPAALSSFYIELLDMKRIGEAYEDWVMIGREEGILPYLAFTGVKDQAPRWPDPAYPQQAHLDLIVDDLEVAARTVLKLGGTKLADKGDVYDIDIFADPVGHPFCMCQEDSPWWHSAAVGTYAASQP
ncbi:VOC family protein [Actinopolymorpha pittospori]